MKNLFKLLLFSMMVICVASCSNRRKELLEAHVEFVAANTTGDYVKARTSLAKVIAINEMLGRNYVYSDHEIDDMKLELFRAEAAEIIAMDTPNSVSRVVILIKQDSGVGQKYKDEMCSFAMNEGMRTRNIELVRSVYLINQDSRQAFNDYLNYIRTLSPVDAIVLLGEVKLLGIKLTPGLNDYYAGRDCEMSFSEYEYNGWSYSQSVITFNSVCTDLIKKSLSNGDGDMVRQILLMMHQNMDITMGGHEKIYKGVEVDGHHCYVEYTNRDINTVLSL